MPRDWHAWYQAYDDPASSLSRRLAEVQRQVQHLLEARPAVVTSMCAGDGRDLLPFLEPGTRALLVELDPDLADRARGAAGQDVEVRTADAGLSDSYAGHPPADVLLACGVFGNITDVDLVATLGALPTLLAPGGHVVWTRGADTGSSSERDAADHVREVLAASGFEEVAFVRPDDASYRVGVHRLAIEPSPLRHGVRLFHFV